ncbi:Serine proteases trypsin domain [Trinorchestia longiramus]|nr:Serine proteases trypsin domain [Trinorchestia longiramus]
MEPASLDKRENEEIPLIENNLMESSSSNILDGFLSWDNFKPIGLWDWLLNKNHSSFQQLENDNKFAHKIKVHPLALSEPTKNDHPTAMLKSCHSSSLKFQDRNHLQRDFLASHDSFSKVLHDYLAELSFFKLMEHRKFSQHSKSTRGVGCRETNSVYFDFLSSDYHCTSSYEDTDTSLFARHFPSTQHNPELQLHFSPTIQSSVNQQNIVKSKSKCFVTTKSSTASWRPSGDQHKKKLLRESSRFCDIFRTVFPLLLILCSSVPVSYAQGQAARQSVVTTVESGGWLLRNLLSLPSECSNEGSLSPCTFLLTCLIQGGTPVNKCGGGYIYTCCVPSHVTSRGVMSVRSDLKATGPSLRHIGGLFRDAPASALGSANLILPPHLRATEASPSRLPWLPEGSWLGTDQRPPHLGPDQRRPPPGVPYEDEYSSNGISGAPQHLSSESQYRTQALRQSVAPLSRKEENHDHEIYYNEPECGVQKLSSNTLTKRIIGGSEARFAELPWQAHIRIAGYQCGGVLVNRYYVATAAHCVHKARLRDITIHLGEFDTKDTGRHYEPYPKESFGVVEKRTHPNFKYMLTQPDRFDVAVLRLSRPASYRPNIVPICLPPPGDHFPGAIGIVAGWGKTDNSYGKTGTNILRKVTVPIIDNQECLRWHHLKNIDVKLHYEMFCAGHSQGKMDACLGDSGGPLVVNNKGRWTLAGITSAGFGCAVDHQPGIYHKVAITSGWIAANVRP